MPIHIRPPRMLRALVAVLVPFEDRAALLDELDVLFAARARENGAFRAQLWYARQVAGFAIRSPGRLFSLGASVMLEARIASRMFSRRPAYAAAFVATLAIGTAVAATTYAVANWVLLRPVPGVRGAASLVTMQLGMSDIPKYVSWDISQPDLETLRDGLRRLGDVAATSRIDVDLRVRDEQPFRVGGEMVTASYFEVLHTRFSAGRAIDASNDADGVVISSRLAKRLARDGVPALGVTLVVNGRSRTVVGITESGFRGAELPGRADVWLPIAALSTIDPGAGSGAVSDRSYGVWRRIIVRKHAGVTTGAVEAAANVVVANVRREFRSHSYQALKQQFEAFEGIGLDPGLRSLVTSTLRIIGAAALLLLVLAIANAGNLVLANEATRGQLVGIQRALGASRSRVALSRLIEHGMLGGVAFITSLVLVKASGALFASAKLNERGAALAGLELDARVAVVTLILALGAAAIAGGFGVTLARRVDVADLLRRGATVGRASHRLRSGFVALQVALSLTLLVVAGLLARTVHNLRQVDLGFEPSGVTTFAVDPRLHGVSGQPLQRLLTDIEIELADANTTAGFIGPSPLTSSYFTGSLYAGPDSTDRVVVGAGYYVSPGFLRAIGARIVAGPLDWRADSGTVIITRSMADSLFPHVDPRLVVGRVVPRRRRGKDLVTIAAVVEDLRLSDIMRPPVPTVFRPIAEGFRDLSVSGFVRRARGGLVSPDQLRSKLDRRAPDLPLFDVSSARSLVDQQFAERTSMALAAEALAAFGVLLAATGLYGVLSTIVTARRRELAIRSALGASASQMYARVLVVGLVPVVAGLVAGTAGCAVAIKFVKAQLYGLQGFDLATYAGGVAMLTLVAAAACLIPARRATHIAPNEALRVE